MTADAALPAAGLHGGPSLRRLLYRTRSVLAVTSSKTPRRNRLPRQMASSIQGTSHASTTAAVPSRSLRSARGVPLACRRAWVDSLGRVQTISSECAGLQRRPPREPEPRVVENGRASAVVPSHGDHCRHTQDVVVTTRATLASEDSLATFSSCTRCPIRVLASRLCGQASQVFGQAQTRSTNSLERLRHPSDRSRRPRPGEIVHRL